MVVYSPNEVSEPGVIRNRGRRNRFVLGEAVAGGTTRAEAAAAMLADAGFEIEITAEIRAAMWQKLLRNIGSGPLAVLGECRSSDTVADPAVAMISRRLAEEVATVAAAHGFGDLGIDLEALSRPGNRPVHKPSILQDLERGRPMEIRSMVTIVQDLARASGVPTPTLDVVLPLMVLKAREAGCYPPPEG
jgi:2-dehydropantoate 2-reductase